MDDIAKIKVAKDTTLAMLLAAAKRKWTIYYFEQNDLFLRNDQAFGIARKLTVQDKSQNWFHFDAPQTIPLNELSLFLIRKDPPFDMQYLYTTYILEQAERQGLLVSNKPQSLRDANEKIYLSWFAQCCPPTLVTANISLLREFLHHHGDMIVKPLDRMGGRGIFRIQQGDPNTSVIFEVATQDCTVPIMAQRYLPEISQGDKRILLIGGKPIPYALARIPQPGETRGNIAAGGRVIGQALSDRDRFLCEAVGPTLFTKGLWFVGLDVIGDYITEINVTSPTGVRELDKFFNLSIADEYLDFLVKQLN